jgi:hypothetical protein
MRVWLDPSPTFAEVGDEEVHGGRHDLPADFYPPPGTDFTNRFYPPILLTEFTPEQDDKTPIPQEKSGFKDKGKRHSQTH